MTTSDDQPGYAEPHDSDLASTTHAEPFDAATLPAPAAPSAGRLLLAVLAALVVAVIGIAVWSYVYIRVEREYVGVAVAIGLGVGYVLRIVSGRSGMLVRIIAVLITIAASLAGTVVSEIAYSADQLGVGIGELFGDYASRWRDALGRRPMMTWGLFAVAAVLAYLSAMPQKPSKKATSAAAREDAAREDADRDDEAPPPHLPAG